MDLEEAITCIEEVKVDKGIASFAPPTLDVRNLNEQSLKSMVNMITFQESFYKGIGYLESAAKDDHPDELEVHRLWKRNSIYESICLSSVFMPLGWELGSLAGGDFKGALVSGVIALSLLAGVKYFEKKKNAIDKNETDEKQITEYLPNLLQDQKVKRMFKETRFDPYNKHLGQLHWNLQKQGINEINYTILAKETEKVKRFISVYQDITSAIANHKSHSRYDRLDIMLASTKLLCDTVKSLTISDEERKERIIRYLKGPTLKEA
jgi:hypothetical protein